MSKLYKINDKYVLYIHIPKTGGSSIQKYLEKYEIKNVIMPGHLDVEETINNMNIDPKKIDFIFTSVRNTWDWRKSFYYYVKSVKSGMDKEMKKLQSLSFKEHLLWLDSSNDKDLTESNYEKGDNLFTKKQIDYIKSKNNILVDYIVYLDRIHEDMNKIKNEFNIEEKFNNHERKSKSSSIKNNEIYDKESIEIVERLYKKDIEFFDFVFKD